MHIGSDRGSARAGVFAALIVGIVGVALAVFVLRPREAPVKPTSTTRAASASTVEKPRPAETPTPAPTTTPAPARRRTAPAPATPAAPEPEVAPRTTGILNIDADVPGASVFIDRVYVGTTPVTARNIVPGRHQLNASAQGYEGISESIEIEAGEKSLTVRFREVRLDTAIDVIHRHGIGSCRGRLVATPQGIRYDTANGGDRFAAPLDAIDELSVDYLKKNLRLKMKGRTYNFTDPEDNADRLFVFQRDVEKARQKMSAR